MTFWDLFWFTADWVVVPFCLAWNLFWCGWAAARRLTASTLVFSVFAGCSAVAFGLNIAAVVLR